MRCSFIDKFGRHVDTIVTSLYRSMVVLVAATAAAAASRGLLNEFGRFSPIKCHLILVLF